MTENSSLRKDNELLKEQEGEQKTEEIKRLKYYEQQNKTNLKEVEFLNEGLKKLKVKVDQLTKEKSEITTFYHNHVKEAEVISQQYYDLLIQFQELQ